MSNYTVKRTSLTDIARLANVSKPVVYTVLKNRENTNIGVSQETRERILKIASELGYVAAKSAKELFTGRSDNIGVILHVLAPYAVEILGSLEKEAHKRHLEITPYITECNPLLEEQYLEQARDGRVDGIIAVSTIAGSIDRYRKYMAHPYNLVILHRASAPTPGVSTVYFDGRTAGELAAQHLVEIGRRRLAFFGGTAQSSRARGFVAGCEKAGLPEPLIFTGEAYATDFQQGRALARDFLHIRPLPDGVFCSNDQLGVALLTQSNDAGLSIPDDMAIVGCDNSEICLYTTPALSSIDTGNSLLASKSLEVLLRLLQDRPDAPVYDNVPVSLVARGSTSGK